MENRRKAIICDLDGTLCLFEKEDKSKAHYRSPYDSGRCGSDLVNQAVLEVVNRFPVIFVSGREDKFRPETLKWLEMHNIAHLGLYMRETGDFRKDNIIKREIFYQHIKLYYEVLFVLDDRDQVVKMWREEGLVCFQVAEGNF